MAGNAYPASAPKSFRDSSIMAASAVRRVDEARLSDSFGTGSPSRTIDSRGRHVREHFGRHVQCARASVDLDGDGAGENLRKLLPQRVPGELADGPGRGGVGLEEPVHRLGSGLKLFEELRIERAARCGGGVAALLLGFLLPGPALASAPDDPGDLGSYRADRGAREGEDSGAMRSLMAAHGTARVGLPASFGTNEGAPPAGALSGPRTARA
jgi:hypothetical protein